LFFDPGQRRKISTGKGDRKNDDAQDKEKEDQPPRPFEPLPAAGGSLPRPAGAGVIA